VGDEEDKLNEEFEENMKQVGRECRRVLEPNHFCAFLIGDTRRNLHYVPVAFRTLQLFLEIGFILREDIIKHQWQCKSTPYWVKKSMESNFLMNQHYFILILLGCRNVYGCPQNPLEHRPNL
jgi:hypothetical protein